MFLYRVFFSAPPPPPIFEVQKKLEYPDCPSPKSVRYKVNLIAKVHSLLTVIITPGMKNPRHKKPRHKNPWNTRRHPRQDPPWQDWGQVTDYKESLIGKVSGDTFYQTSESMSVASLELTFTIIRHCCIL